MNLLEKCPLSANIGNVKEGNPALADNVTCLSSSPSGLQSMLKYLMIMLADGVLGLMQLNLVSLYI